MENKKDKTKGLWAIIGVWIVVIILLLMRSCGSEPVVDNNPNNPNVEDAPIGNFEVSGSQKEKEEVKEVQEEKKTISFAGYGSYKVSSDSPSVELKNPPNNFVDMVFTLTDKASGEIIARTGAVKPGEFVYVNVMEFYTEPGTYDVSVNISTADPESGAAMNGMNQAMQIVVS